jgi:CheY-like chemotaxis protein
LISDVLGRMGSIVQVANSGSDAYEYLKTDHHDLVICDRRMPGPEWPGPLSPRSGSRVRSGAPIHVSNRRARACRYSTVFLCAGRLLP